MRAKWLWMTWLAGLVAGCGEGRAILNVDVYSFIKGTGQDTIPYVVPPNTPNASASSVPQEISLPGAGSSIVDSIVAAGRRDLVNATGSGRIGFQLYLAADAAGTFNPAALALDLPTDSVTPGATVPDTIIGRLLTSDSLFTGTSLWVRVVATGSNADLITAVQGDMVIKSLWLTVFVSDKIF